MDSARQKLLSTLAHKSFRLGEFKLSSGGTSDYYIDCRTTTLDAKGSKLTGEVFTEEIRRQAWKWSARCAWWSAKKRKGGAVWRRPLRLLHSSRSLPRATYASSTSCKMTIRSRFLRWQPFASFAEARR